MRPDLADWLTLLRVPGVGPVTYKALIRVFGSPGQALRARHSELKRFGFTEEIFAHFSKPNLHAIDQDLAWSAQPPHHVLVIGDPEYPRQLREIHGPPPVLFVNGDPHCLADPQIAIVGSRRPTPAGRDNAHTFAAHMANAGLIVTSGLAIGIDGASHEGALAAGGLSIAVAATGLDRVYPARHRELATRIAARGALVSEFPTGVAPRAEHFPRRNRLISGLSLGVLVVEAARRSGSLITAGCAAEQGREVFAIPGSIHNPVARGCHHLIRQGAKLVESAYDILEEIRSQIEPYSRATPHTEPALVEL
ncbi:MAG: DNA-protecting protein DprA, partial [Gammaproteobacteria bacterium]|nr:DNA-protecting protein DprA [Gammaproteobacteria bacterium]